MNLHSWFSSPRSRTHLWYCGQQAVSRRFALVACTCGAAQRRLCIMLERGVTTLALQRYKDGERMEGQGWRRPCKAQDSLYLWQPRLVG